MKMNGQKNVKNKNVSRFIRRLGDDGPRFSTVDGARGSESESMGSSAATLFHAVGHNKLISGEAKRDHKSSVLLHQ